MTVPGGCRPRRARAAGRWTIRRLCTCALLASLPAWFFAADAIATPADALATAGGGTALVVGDSADTARFVRERVQPVLVEHCAECHGNGHRKGGFRMDSLALMLASEGDFGPALVPWDTARSAIVAAIRHAGDSDLDMPPNYRLPPAQVDDLVRWIGMGAPWPASASITAPAPTPAATATASPPGAAVAASSTGTPSPEPAPTTRPPFAGRLHPVLVHLPLGAFGVALALELLVLLGWRPLRPAVLAVLAVALLGAVAAIISGTLLADPADVGSTLARHRLLGWATAIAAALTLTIGIITARRTAAWRWLVRVLLLASVGLVVATGHLGGGMVWGAHWLW